MENINVTTKAQPTTTCENGFVAGTLVHTKEGLRPIEQIKVGDCVLSKPESGEAIYKRVVRSFEYEDREVYFVSYSTGIDEFIQEQMVVTGNHPFWVERLEGIDGSENISGWVTADKLYEMVENTGMFPMFVSKDGRLAKWGYSGPLLRTTNPLLGIVYINFEQNVFEDGVGIDFSTGYPEALTEEYMGRESYQSIPMDIEPEDYIHAEKSILSISGGYHPMLRKVYTLEVEDNHTYFVGDAGVLVHENTGSLVA